MALRASGTSQYAIRTTGGFYDTSACSFLVWAYLETDKNASGAIWGIRQGGAAYLYLYNPSGDGTTFGWEDGSGGNPQVDLNALSLNTWTCLAFSKSGATITAYRRTASSATFSSASSSSFNSGFTPDEEIAISNGFDTTNGYFPGRIAGMKQWTAALTEAELLNESHFLMPVRTANLHSWRPMADNTVAGSMIDYSGNARPLTANGSLSVADGPPVAWRQGARRIFIPAAAGGGTTFNITPSGAITPTGALIKQANKGLAGAVTPAGAILKAVSKPFSGAITPAGTLLKMFPRLYSGSITPSGAMLRQAQKVLSGSATPTGAIAKAASKPLAGAVTPTGALSTIKVILRAFTGAITPTGALVRQAAKALSGSITPTGALSKFISKVFSGAITPTGALSALKVVFRSFAGSITPTGLLTRSIGKGLSGSITPVGSIAKLVSKLFSGILTLSGNLITFVAGAPLQNTIVTVSDELVTTASASDELVTICTVSDEIGG